MKIFRKNSLNSLANKPRNFYSRFKNGELKRILREQLLATGESNAKIAMAIGFGLFMSIFPIWGFQTLAALFLAAFFKLNKGIVLVATSVSIPPIIPFYLYASFYIGGWVMGQSSAIRFSNQFSFATIQADLLQYYTGAAIFALLMGVLFAAVGYLLLSIFRKEPKNTV